MDFKASEVSEARNLGIDILGSMPWGTHICQFYENKQDLIDVLVPYFRAGLENNESCIYITSENLTEKEAEEAFGNTIPDFPRYLASRQMEIIPATEWYLKGGTFNGERVINAWIDKIREATSRAYEGLRVSGDADWLESADWPKFTHYEEEVNNAIGKYPMLAICHYPLNKCGTSEIMDVECNHRYSLFKHKGKLVLITNSPCESTEEVLPENHDNLERLTNSMWDTVLFSVKMPERVITWVNASSRLFGYEPQECIGRSMEFLYPDKRAFRAHGNKLRKALAEGKDMLHTEQLLKRRNGEVFPALVNTTFHREKGEVVHITSFIRDITRRRRASEEIQHKTEDLLLLNLLDETANRGGSPAELLQVLARETKKIFSGYGATVYLLSKDKKDLVIQNLTLPPRIRNTVEKLIGGKIPKARIRLVPGGLYSKILKNGKSELVNNPRIIQRFTAEFTQDKRLKKLVPKISQILGIRSMICTPLVSGGRAIGLMDVSRRGAPFTESDMHRLEIIAEHFTVIIRKMQAEKSQKLPLQAVSGKTETQLQKKFMREGFENLNDSAGIRLIFNLCRYRPECDSNIRQCIKHFKSARELLSASTQELQQAGVCPRGLFTLRLLRELPAVVLKQRLTERSVYQTSGEVFDYLYYSMRDLKHEVLKVLYLNNLSQIIDVADLYEGTKDSIQVRPREIVESAISHGATGLIFTHNHPTGNPNPSKTDKQLTRDLVFVGLILQINILDHIIIGDNSYFSFADEGLIQKYHDSFLDLKIRGVLASSPIYHYYNKMPGGLHFQRIMNALSNNIRHLKRK